MPRVALTARQEVQNAARDDAKAARGWLASEGIKMKRVAELAGVTPQAVSLQFRKGRLMPETAAALRLLREGRLPDR